MRENLVWLTTETNIVRIIKTMRNFAQNMNWTVIIIETLVKNPVWWIHDYPNDIQERLLAGLRRRIRNVAFH